MESDNQRGSVLSGRFAGFLPIAALAAGLAVAGLASAQPVDRDAGVLSLDRIIGVHVLDQDGRHLGVIRDLFIDDATRKVESIAVAPPGQPARLERYPVDLLVAGQPGEVIVLTRSSASAGASAPLVPLKATGATLATSHGPASALVVNFADGTLAPAAPQ